MQFQKAERKQAKLRLALSGPAGSGKTWAAIKIAAGLGGKFAVIDTERGSASLYSDLADFSVLDLSPPFSPERYIEALLAAQKAGFDTIVIDSISHEWNGSGGCLEINETMANSKFKGNTWAAWNATTPRHRAFIDAILQSPLHVIATMRSKTETAQRDGGKVVKVGVKNEARDGTEYEFAVVLELTHDNHLAVATKDRTRLFKDPHIVTEKTGELLKDWLSSGALAPVIDEAPENDPMVLVNQLVSAAHLRDDIAVNSLWNGIKANKLLAKAVWVELKNYDVEFKFISGLLRK